MTKVTDAKTADGSTPWFKIKDIGPQFTNGNAKWIMNSRQHAPGWWVVVVVVVVMVMVMMLMKNEECWC
jgi:hypothetical protein